MGPRLRLIVIGLGIVVFGLFLFFPQLAGVRSGLVSLAVIPGAAISSIGTILHVPGNRASDEVRTLTEERNTLVLENARLRSLEQENQEMRELLEVQERARYQFVPAQVIGKTPEVETQALLLDRGSADGVMVGMPVVASDGFLLGKISQTSEHASVVVLVTDSRSRVAATVLNNDRTLGYVEGGGGLGMSFRLIPQHELVTTGDTVVTSGLEAGVPRGLVIGRVGRVSREPQEPFQTAVVNQVIAPDRRQIVGIVRQIGEGL